MTVRVMWWGTGLLTEGLGHQVMYAGPKRLTTGNATYLTCLHAMRVTLWHIITHVKQNEGLVRSDADRIGLHTYVCVQYLRSQVGIMPLHCWLARHLLIATPFSL